MAATLALVSAVCFALAATLQQRGQFALARAGEAVEGVAGLFRLVAVPVWLLGTLVLFAGYATQGAALDRGKLVVIQPLLVTTIVWALPLGSWLTNQVVTRRQVLGAGVVVAGLAMFVLIGDPDAGTDNAATESLVLAAVVISAMVAGLLLWLRTQTSPALHAAVLGVCAGLFFGLSATFTKPVLNDLHVSIGQAAGDWRTWGLLGFGFVAFIIQQLSLATGQLAPAMAAVSVANPAVSVILGILLFDERLTRPGWHVVVAGAALLAALGGAVLITLANRDTEMPTRTNAPFRDGDDG
ncbi:MAG: DMT family transporter [Solirubrobacteraceae bacterium]|nr:DMT family transporter [Solirubrobacteraceae bacterium]